MIHPASIYRYRHCSINPKTGKLGTRWDYVGHEGAECPALIVTLKRDGARVLYYGLNTRTHKLGLWRGKNAENPTDTGWISEIFEPDIKKPGLGFGDLGDRGNVALLIRADEHADSLTIMVFPGLGKQGKVLYEQWGLRAVAESIRDSNVSFPTLSVQEVRA